MSKKEITTPSADAKWKWLLFALAFILYANTANFDYALDDKIVITANQITKQGFSGFFDHLFYDSMDGFWAEQYGVDVEDLDKGALVAGGRYRPLSLMTFALEYQFFGENSGLSHVINALLYAFLALLLYQFLQQLFPITGAPYKSVAFWTTLLFVVHPLHVEVVANIKSRDELLCMVFGILALQAMVEFAKNKDNMQLAMSSVWLFLSLMSKETTIAFVALGPLTLYFFNIGGPSEIKKSFVGLLAAGLAYTLVRTLVIGSQTAPIAEELMNDPFLLAEGSEKMATILLVFAAYIKLLVLPYPLTHDYYPFHLPFLEASETYASFSSLGTIVGVIVLIGVLVVIVRGFKSKSVFAYAGLFFMGTAILVSNLFFPIGVFMNERFMFMPSLAFTLVISYAVLAYKNGKWTKFQPALIFMALGFSLITFTRVPAWRNDASLALTDVTTSAGSAKANMAAGDALIREIADENNELDRQEMINEAYGYLKASLDIYPGYFPPLDLLGKLYFDAGNYKESVRFYEMCIQRKPNDQKFKNNLFYIGNRQLSEQKYDEAILTYERVLAYNPNNVQYLLAVAEVYARYKQMPSKALPYMRKANALDPENDEVTEKLGITFAMLNRYKDAIAVLEPLLAKNPQNKSVMRNLGIAYYKAGYTDKGQQLMDQSEGQ